MLSGRSRLGAFCGPPCGPSLRLAHAAASHHQIPTPSRPRMTIEPASTKGALCSARSRQAASNCCRRSPVGRSKYSKRQRFRGMIAGAAQRPVGESASEPKALPFGKRLSSFLHKRKAVGLMSSIDYRAFCNKRTSQIVRTQLQRRLIEVKR